VGEYVTDAPTDKQQLVPALQNISEEVAAPENILADTGYYGDAFILEAESGGGPTVYCAQAKSGHRLRVADLEKHPLREPPPPGAPMKEQMAHRLQTPEGKALYKLRKQTVEPVFGVIKEVLGFRRFSMRGKEKAGLEWCLVCLSYNLKKMFKLAGKCAPKHPAAVAKQHICTFLAPLRAVFG
jgi:Transposase DDE domain